MFKQTRRIILTAALALVACTILISDSPSAAAQEGGIRRYRVRLATLHCVDPNESGILSNGDEPFVITIAIIDDGGVPTFHYQRTRIYSGVDAGEDRNPNLDLMHRPAVESVVVVSQVVEHDNSDHNVVSDQAANLALWAFEDAVDAGEDDTWALGQIVADELHAWLITLFDEPGDDDEVIGQPGMYIATRATFDGLARGATSTVRRRFSGQGAIYDLNFQITRTD